MPLYVLPFTGRDFMYSGIWHRESGQERLPVLNVSTRSSYIAVLE